MPEIEQVRPSSAPISREEMIELFGDAMPIEAANLLWDGNGDKTLAELRSELRALAASRPTPDLGGDELERRTRAVENVSSFANFANGRLPPHVSDDLKIVVELARAALSQVR